MARRGANPRLVDNTLSSPQYDGIAVGKRGRDILRLYKWVAGYRALEASLTSLWKSILKLGSTWNIDPWCLDSEVENITKDNEARRKQSWLKWVAEGNKKTGKLFRWIKNSDTISPAQHLNHGEFDPEMDLDARVMKLSQFWAQFWCQYNELELLPLKATSL